jgi:acetolactate synthase-1/2/3 large subunit
MIRQLAQFLCMNKQEYKIMRHGGQILADQLKRFGTKRVFSVPGESFLAALDGLYENGIPNIVCRHEGAAAMMAEAYGKMTGTPGIAFVTRGPGAGNASAGVHIAAQDSTPMILFVGQIAQHNVDREAFQEVDYKSFFGGMAKWVAQIDQIERIPEYVARAYRVATSGRPGPVVLALPENMLSGHASVPDARNLPIEPAADLRQAACAVLDKLKLAKRPLVVVGGPHWSSQAASDLAQFAQTQDVPVALSFRRQDYMDNRHPNYVGDLNVGINPKLAQRVRDADCLLLLGTRFGDIASADYSLVNPADPQKTILHIHAAAEEISRVYGADLAITATAPDMISALAEVPAVGAWRDWTASARADFEAWATPKESPGEVKLEQVIKHLSDTLPDDAFITNGAGNYAAWTHRYFIYKHQGTQLAPTSGSMGYGFPAAISAKLEHPEKDVICMAGDGCFQMTLNEFSTCVQHGVNVVVIVVNNGRYGTIRMHQEKNYPGRVSGTELANPDYAALARAYGGHGETVTKTDQFSDAFGRALAANLPAIIELQVDDQALTPSATLDQIRALAQ